MTTGFNILDLVFITFTIIFVLTAFFRGFIKEVFALFNWIVALALSYLLAPYAADLLGKYYGNKIAIDIAARSIIFIVAFFVTAMSTSGLRDSIKDKVPKTFDRSLGVLFGFLKTLIIFGFVYSLYINLYGFLLGDKRPEGVAMQHPSWLKDARCYSLIKFSGDTLDPAVKEFFNAATKNFDKVIPDQPDHKDLDAKIDEVVDEKKGAADVDEAVENSTKAVKSGTTDVKKTVEDSGYNKKDIEKMNRLIEIVQ